jgi:hypothetical protein
VTRKTVQAALEQCSRWRRSGYSDGENNCVEITTELPGWTGVRDSKQGGLGPILAVTNCEWWGLINYLGRSTQ